jgi:hypothetical protein
LPAKPPADAPPVSDTDPSKALAAESLLEEHAVSARLPMTKAARTSWSIIVSSPESGSQAIDMPVLVPLVSRGFCERLAHGVPTDA